MYIVYGGQSAKYEHHSNKKHRSKLKDLCFKNRHKPYTHRYKQAKTTA